MTGLYDNQGMLRFTGRDQADCLAYAELFGLGTDGYSLAALADDGSTPLEVAPAA
ncbi:hypothetical protein KBY70_08390 [Cyanobium sp. ATX 6E8]|uniref:hypothetical protein n=1 Tax=Cyanobium sp. ATX 6E8 TaxID=2823701 RepID=UPI0020CF76D2|nr:hypothetical protein [Cyanobium sp. ATX 6E8]MCP9942404.1 hypothetical protein [Cyanobium sp. ATX 6E8]